MTTCAEDVKTILEAGTWSNYGSCPEILIKRVDSIRGALNNRLALIDIDETPIYAYNNVRIYDEKKTCELSLEGITTTDRDNMILDIQTILEASTTRPIIKGPKITSFRNRYIYKMTIIIT